MGARPWCGAKHSARRGFVLTRCLPLQDDFKNLEEAETLAEQAIDAAEKDGDLEEAEMQQEARAGSYPPASRRAAPPARSPRPRRPICAHAAAARAQVLEELEEKVIEVAAAEESEAAHSAAAEDAASRGDFDEASDEALLAEEAAEAAEEAEEELADAVARAKELASMSLAERLNPATLATAVKEYAPQAAAGASAAVDATRTALRSRIDLVLGDYPLLATFLEWLSLVLPVLMLTGGFALLRRDATGEFSLRSEVLLFGHMYWAGYYGLLALTTAIMYTEPPLTAFARAQPEQYVAYQVLLLLLFMAYIVLLISHVTIERSAMAGLQLAGGLVVYVHSYLTVAHPAMRAALPPTTKGFLWFAIYSCIFSSMTGLIKRERKGVLRLSFASLRLTGLSSFRQGRLSPTIKSDAICAAHPRKGARLPQRTVLLVKPIVKQSLLRYTVVPQAVMHSGQLLLLLLVNQL